LTFAAPSSTSKVEILANVEFLPDSLPHEKMNVSLSLNFPLPNSNKLGIADMSNGMIL
jgi:hypothetical protein